MIKYGFIFGMSFLFGLTAASTTQQVTETSAVCTGPTLQLNYTPSEQLQNTVDAFMYFVPLNSLSAVSTETDPNTSFAAGIINWNRKDFRNNTFTLTCDFEITGSGLYKVVYDPGEMINLVARKHRKDKKLTGLLDWIQFDGACKGRIEAKGKNQGKDTFIEEVVISFNRDGQRSPVTIAIYDIPRVDKRFDYSNRQNSTLARVNTLTFRRSEDDPRMNVEIATVSKPQETEGFFSSLTAMFANLLLSAQPVSAVGNDTMLDFGLALYHKKPEFTFPVAEALRPSLASAQVSAF
jgi:hypothetical protein